MGSWLRCWRESICGTRLEHFRDRSSSRDKLFCERKEKLRKEKPIKNTISLKGFPSSNSLASIMKLSALSGFTLTALTKHWNADANCCAVMRETPKLYKILKFNGQSHKAFFRHEIACGEERERRMESSRIVILIAVRKEYYSNQLILPIKAHPDIVPYLKSLFLDVPQVLVSVQRGFTLGFRLENRAQGKYGLGVGLGCCTGSQNRKWNISWQNLR